PEGLPLEATAGLARGQLGVPHGSLLAAAADPALLSRLGLAGVAGTAEGYLYPTTYTVRMRVGAAELVRLMTDQFLAHWQAEWQPRLDTLRMTRHQLVTLASIIQAAVRYRPDREYAAAVAHHPLRNRTLL